ncbi:g u mismatch-specific dna glycosylase [Fusarium agapanthi]|uniref:G u mismatch-specific dna glycosylase n=1 Tax=Fusarium agapanthi TaxID=1803897 RepID=A0A9P5BQI2_9HYPO|nr:g u mismatch-specific dna glycosylase [Fusarium agapanthi]
MGNTNLAGRPSKTTSELSKQEMAEGTPVLEDKIRRYKPEAVCFVGKGIWEAVWMWRYGRDPTKQEFRYGRQDETENLGRSKDGVQEQDNGGGVWDGAKVFVATSTSGLAAHLSMQEKEAIWNDLGVWVKKRRSEETRAAVDNEGFFTALPSDRGSDGKKIKAAYLQVSSDMGSKNAEPSRIRREPRQLLGPSSELGKHTRHSWEQKHLEKEELASQPSITRATRNIGWNLSQQLVAGQVDATVLTPISVIIALAMLAGAADSHRQSQLHQKLGVTESLEADVSTLYTSLTPLARQDLISLANAVFVDQSVELAPRCKKYLESFQAHSQHFLSLSDSEKDINSWISQNTLGQILVAYSAPGPCATAMSFLSTLQPPEAHGRPSLIRIIQFQDIPFA